MTEFQKHCWSRERETKKPQTEANTTPSGRVTYNEEVTGEELLAVTINRCHTRCYRRAGSLSVYCYTARITVTEINSQVPHSKVSPVM